MWFCYLPPPRVCRSCHFRIYSSPARNRVACAGAGFGWFVGKIRALLYVGRVILLRIEAI